MGRRGSGPEAPSSQGCLRASSLGVQCSRGYPSPHSQGREKASFRFSPLMSGRDVFRVGRPGIKCVPLRIALLLAPPFLGDIRKLPL